MKSPWSRARPGHVVEVFAAACSGCARLSEKIGLPVVLIDTAFTAEVAIERLNDCKHASGVRCPGFFQPIFPEFGWSDWGLFPIMVDASVEWRVADAAAEGVSFTRDRIIVALEQGVTLPEFAVHLQAALRHFRLQEVTARASYMDARSDSYIDFVVHPRYSPGSDGGFRGAEPVSNVYALDPTDAQWRLYWLVVTARLAASGGWRSKWR